MSLQLLCLRMAGVSPEAKFFLLKFLQYYSWGQSVVFSSREMVNRFGIPDKTIKKALDELCGRKYLSRSGHLTGARGRPKYEYVVEEELVKIWSQPSAPISHAQIIEKLLEVTPERQEITNPESVLLPKRKTGKGQAQKFLTNTRKLLLCTLLAKADRFGVIRELGMSELASLVGLSKEQLRWHLKILRGSKYLFDYIPGAAIRGIRGKLKSIFIVNLDWSRRNSSPNRLSLIHDSEVLRFFNRAVQLVYALEAVNGQLENRGFNAICKSQFPQWESIYRFDKIDYERIVDSAQLLGSLGGTNRPRFRRLCMFLCELVAMLIAEYGLIDSGELPENEVEKAVREEGKRRRLNIVGAGTRMWNVQSLLWFSALVLRLYDEISGLVKYLNTENEAQKVSSFLISPISDTSYLLIHPSVDPVQVQAG